MMTRVEHVICDGCGATSRYPIPPGWIHLEGLTGGVALWSADFCGPTCAILELEDVKSREEELAQAAAEAAGLERKRREIDPAAKEGPTAPGDEEGQDGS